MCVEHSSVEFLWNLRSLLFPVVRATARTTNLSVILLGAGLTAVLGYALISELFSNNSPTVLYGEACEKIKESPRVCWPIPLYTVADGYGLGREVFARTSEVP